MDDNMKLVLNGLMEAVMSEKDGQNFYLMAASNTLDEKGREVFHTLAKEEAEHVRYLLAQYKAIMDSGKPDETLKLPKRHVLTGDSPIFSDSLKSRIKDAHMEMSALSIGIQLELGAIQFYRSQADLAKDQFIKDFYMELVEWEQAHYQALLAQQQSLKEDYWQSSGFSPY